MIMLDIYYRYIFCESILEPFTFKTKIYLNISLLYGA